MEFVKRVTDPLTITLLTWRIWRVPTNASKRQMGFNSAFKRLKMYSAITYNKKMI